MQINQQNGRDSANCCYTRAGGEGGVETARARCFFTHSGGEGGLRQRRGWGRAGVLFCHTHGDDIFKVFKSVEVVFEGKWAFCSQSLLRFFMHMKIHFPLISFYLKLFINNFFKMATLMCSVHALSDNV